MALQDPLITSIQRYQTISRKLGFDLMAQDNCVYKCTPIEGQPSIYVGLYVDDLVYYSKSDKVEEWSKNYLKPHVKVAFMDDASWFLGQCYDSH